MQLPGDAPSANPWSLESTERALTKPEDSFGSQGTDAGVSRV